MMLKLAPVLFFVASALFYLSAFLQSQSRAVYISLGTVFLILGIVNLRRRQSKMSK